MVPAATVIVPSAFMVMDPAAGVGAAPGVRVIAAGSTVTPFSVSLASTVPVAPPVAPLMDAGASSTASITAAPTMTVAVAVSQLVGFITSQIS